MERKGATPREWRYWRNLLLVTVSMLSLGILLAFITIGYRSAHLYAHPPRVIRPAETPARFGIDYEDVEFLTEDGVTLSAWYTPPRNGALILVAHGYAGRRSDEIHAALARHGYGVLSWDARAHGTSGGETSTIGYFEVFDVEGALAYALRQPSVLHVGALGQSMGAVAIIQAAARHPEIEAVVADSAFTTLDEMVARGIPVPLLRPLVRFFAEQATEAHVTAVRPIDEIGRISPRPILLIQGGADQTVPPDAAPRLYAAAGEPRALWMEEGIGHIEMRAVYPDEYDRRVLAFFDASLRESKDGQK